MLLFFLHNNFFFARFQLIDESEFSLPPHDPSKIQHNLSDKQIIL